MENEKSCFDYVEKVLADKVAEAEEQNKAEEAKMEEARKNGATSGEFVIHSASLHSEAGDDDFTNVVGWLEYAIKNKLAYVTRSDSKNAKDYEVTLSYPDHNAVIIVGVKRGCYSSILVF